MKEKLLTIINHYGVMPQLKYLQTEIFEFNQAVIEHQYDENKSYEIIEAHLKEHIKEELADIMVILFQFKEYFKLNNDEITEIMNYKINRQLERIENDR